LIHSVRDNIVTSSHRDYKNLINIIFDASIESSIISKRISSSINIRRKLGSYIGKVPFGYKCNNTIDRKSGIKIRKLVQDAKEQNIIDFINKLYYGCKIPILYSLYNKITMKNNFKLFEHNGIEFNEVYYGNLCISDIHHLLSLHSIKKKECEFTKSNISSIVSKNTNYKKNLMYKNFSFAHN
jgi:hypothetical protein